MAELLTDPAARGPLLFLLAIGYVATMIVVVTFAQLARPRRAGQAVHAVRIRPVRHHGR